MLNDLKGKSVKPIRSIPVGFFIGVDLMKVFKGQ